MLKRYSDLELPNIGTSEDIAIADFARLVADVVGFRGQIEFDTTRPDGAPRKLLDASRIMLGWRATIPLREGLSSACMPTLSRATTSSAPRRKRSPPISGIASSI